MKEQAAGGGHFCGGRSPDALYREAVEYLQEAFSLPPDKLEREVDEAERRVAKLRDCLIERLRADLESGAESRWRKPLDGANVALSLIASAEYPATGIHKSYMEQAEKVLREMEQDLKRME